MVCLLSSSLAHALFKAEKAMLESGAIVSTQLVCLRLMRVAMFLIKIFGSVWYMPGVMRFEPHCKVRGVANIEVGVRGSVPQDVDIMKM